LTLNVLDRGEDANQEEDEDADERVCLEEQVVPQLADVAGG
jgi:hypothetical protein